jgi:hypothetical protein
LVPHCSILVRVAATTMRFSFLGHLHFSQDDTKPPGGDVFCEHLARSFFHCASAFALVSVKESVHQFVNILKLSK